MIEKFTSDMNIKILWEALSRLIDFSSHISSFFRFPKYAFAQATVSSSLEKSIFEN